MSESQYAVFRFDVKTMVMADDTPLIFDSLPDAERHCQENIATTPAQGCRILDHFGKTVRTFSDDQLYDEHHGAPPLSEMCCRVQRCSWPVRVQSRWMPGFDGGSSSACCSESGCFGPAPSRQSMGPAT